MERAIRAIGWSGMVSAGAILLALHTLPSPRLHATTGVSIPYRPWNFLSEFVRSDYGPWMTASFFLLAIAALATAVTLRPWRREAALLAVAGGALALLGFFPTDLADLTTDDLTCGRPTRIEPCTWVGRVHNPLSTLVFAPILLAMVSVTWRARTEPRWRNVARFALACVVLALAGVGAATLYLQTIGWQGRWWTGLMQRSLVFPALLWVAALLTTAGKRSEP